MIDLVRALLAIWVVFTHLLTWAPLIEGARAVPAVMVNSMNWLIGFFQPNGELHPAVVCFIVLSGYCIHRSGLRREHADVRGYAIRRFLRIYPVYLLATLFGVICFFLTDRPRFYLAHLLSGTPAVTPACVAVKLSLVNAIDPSQLICAYGGNAPLATVMVEMVLYVAYPLLLLGLSRRFGEPLLWVVVVGAWAAGVVIVNSHSLLYNWWENASFVSFLIYWWIGAKFLDPGFARRLSQYWYLPLILFGVLSAAILWRGLDSLWLSEARKVSEALLFGLLVVQIDRARLWLPAPLEGIGKAGYSIYAFHAPLVYALLALRLPWWVIVVSAVGLGLVSYRLIERPGIALGKRLAGRRGQAPVLSSGASIQS
jgi:peptidoglycan/LPS O-acetylase OafA/YrhL